MNDTPVGNAAYERLREALVAGRFQPEQRLVETDMAEWLQVRRVEVREAFTWLEKDRLIERRAHRGVIVKLLSQDEARDILRVRRHVEGLVVRWAAQKRTDDDCQRLAAKLAELVQCHDETDLTGYSAAQAALHHELVDLAGSPTLARMVESLSAQTAQTRLRSLMSGGRFKASVSEHAAIVEAVVAGDADRAEQAMHLHIDNVLAAVLGEHQQHDV
jgi:DNA-binding GntR family transcriptional regulator